jgi:putative transcriptional regulator
MSDDSLKGQLLIAAPALLDPNFRRTVVLLLEHQEEGAVGVVLNRPSPVAASDALPNHAPLFGDGEPVFAGGPVQPAAAIALAEFGDPTSTPSPVLASIGVADLETEPGSLATQVARVRIFAGYAGWGAGQLDAELAEDAWFTEPALPGDVFTDRPDRLWSSVLERKGGAFRLIARMPEDPSVN